ncbi:hypothetical protein [Streptomyces sp. NPDC056165]|uniref:hypothetical protein n=1 Tax=Streptomyces sp. NPDC056165 TaxID=3345733 RepID=UPI0035D5BFF4
MSPGKQASESGAAPPMAAGVELEKMRRRVSLSRLALFTAIAAGPAALGVAVMSGPATVAAARSDKPAAVRSAATAADPAGYAQVFVDAWLRSSADDANSAQARLAQSLAPDVELPGPVASAQSKPASVTAVRSAQREDGARAVTVAAQYADGRLRYFVVPVAADACGASFAVTGAPGVVAGPARAAVGKSPYGVSVPSDGWAVIPEKTDQAANREKRGRRGGRPISLRRRHPAQRQQPWRGADPPGGNAARRCLPADRGVRVPGEHREEVELFGAQRQFLLAEQAAAGAGVHGQVAEALGVFLGRGGRVAAQVGAEASQQDGEAEGFDQVVVGAGLALAPEHRRGHGALYGGLNHGRIEVARLRRGLAEYGVHP